MTSKTHPSQAKYDSILPTVSQIPLGLLLFFCLLLILRNADVAVRAMRQGLSLCAQTVIPALFPFLVLSEMIATCGVGTSLLCRFSKPLGRLLRLSEAGCCAYLLGTLCGFPIGTRYTTVALAQGRITQEEAERVIGISSCPSSAFLISAVGTALYGSAGFGIALYVSVLAAALCTGLLLAHLPNSKKTAACAPIQSVPPHTPVSVKTFCDAMRTSATNMLLICAYVVFFSALIGTFAYFPPVQALPETARAALFCLFELSSGMNQAATLPSPIHAACLAAFAAGWSGISVHCQTLSLCDRTGLSLRPYFASKLMQSILAPLILLGILTLLPITV